jgi:hypothetical protein
VTLARRRGGIEGEETERLLRALDTTEPRPLGTGTMAEASGILRVGGPESAGIESEAREPAGAGTQPPPPGW